MKETKILIFLSILLILVIAGLIFVFFNNKPTLVHYSYFSSKEFFDEAVEQGERQARESSNRIYGGILPHHLIVKDKIAAFFKGIEENNYETIVLIGPNHFGRGKSKVMASETRWSTPYGFLEPDLILIDKLKNLSVLRAEEPPFDYEYSISGLVSFIKKYFPDSKFVPIILRANITPQESSDLAKTLFDSVGNKNVLVLASVDFSHYQPVSVADFHDLKSNSVIQSFDFDRIYDLEIDSPPSVYVLLKYLELIKTEEGDLIFSTNSGALIGKNDIPTTSHNFFYFQKGEKSDKKLINFLFFGDLMLDRNVGKIIKENGLDYIFNKLAGEENKFFEGVDIISANLEGAVTNEGTHYKPDFAYDFAFAPDLIKWLKKYNFNFLNLANNHFSDQGEKGMIETRNNLDELKINYSGCSDQETGECSSTIIRVADKKIGMTGFSMIYAVIDIEKAKEIVRGLKEASDFVVVNMHWSAEYTHKFSAIQQQIAHGLIDAGADIIIGHHPHVVQGIEIYKTKPIFYSLGNFVFDQYFSQDTQEGLSIGLAVSNFIDISIFPLKLEFSRPQLMVDNEKKEFLDKLILWSEINPEISNQIINGKIRL